MAGLGDGDKVWVKATANYEETVDIDGHQASWNDPVVFEGYTSSTGDGGKVTIDGGAARASGIVQSGFAGNTNYVFKNFDGCASGSGSIYIGCEFLRNTNNGIDGEGAVVAAFCTFFSNGAIGIDNPGATNDVMTVLINCTVDGDSKDTTDGLLATNAFRHFGAVVNCIMYDCGTGISFSNEEAFISRNNLLNSNTADYGNGANTYTGEVTDAPAFSDEGSQDYSLSVSSPAREAGYDASTVAGGTSKIDIGSRESTDTGGPGGANKRGGKQ
jgi:hypothetical protein